MNKSDEYQIKKICKYENGHKTQRWHSTSFINAISRWCLLCLTRSFISAGQFYIVGIKIYIVLSQWSLGLLERLCFKFFKRLLWSPTYQKKKIISKKIIIPNKFTGDTGAVSVETWAFLHILEQDKRHIKDHYDFNLSLAEAVLNQGY